MVVKKTRQAGSNLLSLYGEATTVQIQLILCVDFHLSFSPV